MDIEEYQPETSCPYCRQIGTHHEECPESTDWDDVPEFAEEPDLDALPFVD